jgi:hypothetical protein
MISALLDAERVTPDPKPAATPEAKPDTPAQPPADAPEPGNNAAVEGADAEPDEQPVAEIPLEQLEAIELETTFKADDGKDVTEKLPIKELKLGYMRQRDYQRKTAELARQRNETSNSIRQGVEAERAQYASALEQMKSAISELAAPELKNVDWNDLAVNNPFEYVRLDNRRRQISDALKAVEAKQQELKTKTEESTRQAQMETAKKTWEALESDIPGWNSELYAATLKASESVGFTPAEAGQWLDPRAIKLLHKAYLYDQFKAGQPPAEKKVVKAPVATKPGAAAAVPKAQEKRGKAIEQLRKSGRIEDMASVIASMG